MNNPLLSVAYTTSLIEALPSPVQKEYQPIKAIKSILQPKLFYDSIS